MRAEQCATYSVAEVRRVVGPLTPPLPGATVGMRFFTVAYGAEDSRPVVGYDS